jgi:phosphoglycerol transferase
VIAGVVSVVLIGGVLGANLLPSLLYTREHGKNTEVAHRQAAEVDVYGLRVIQLLTPIPDHRLEPLARLSNDLQQTPYNSEQSMFLGLVGSIGLLGMIGALLVRVARPGAAPADDGDGDDDDDDDDDGGRGRLPRRGDDVRPLFGVLTIVIILVATMGGLAWFLAVAGFTELRGWNRISIVVAFLALAWLALSIDRLLAHRSYGVRGRALLALAGVVVIVFGIADQTSKQIVPDRRTYQAEFHADRDYFGAIEDRLPRGAAVFQLPYIPFPEAGPVNNIVEYDPLRPYLNTKHLRWSYGGMKGRDSDWQAVAATEPTAQVVQDAIATGFSGVLVDRNGYQDKAESLTAELAQLTGDPGFASADDRWVFFDLAVPTAQYNQSTTPAQRASRRAEVLAARP